MSETVSIHRELTNKFGDVFTFQETHDGLMTLWVEKHQLTDVLRYLKKDIDQPYNLLYDLSVIDERNRQCRNDQPASSFTTFYHLMSLERNDDIRLKVAGQDDYPTLPSITNLWANASWYEREAFDMFGVQFEGHKNLRRILMPETWKGHPLRKEHPARATEMGPYELNDQKEEIESEKLKFKPEEWGMQRKSEDADFMFLNLGPQHPGTHGILRLVVQLDGENVVDIVPDIGYHHRGAEKMAERQTWHGYIPYTDRIDYLAGVNNNLPYVMAVERMAGIEVPDRAKVIRIMLCELFRIASHLVWYGTFAQDLGQLSPTFYTFNDRERILDIVEAICGARMHPNWFRIGGVAQPLPEGWNKLIMDFVEYFPKRLKEWDRLIMGNQIFKARTIGIGIYDTKEAIEWGVTGPGLRATGLEWDFRKKRPYSGYDQFEFEIPTGENGDCYDRSRVRVEEMRQSLRIIEQCVKNMPDGSYKSDHPLTTPPRKERTMHDIETLINHFVHSTWGPVIPAGEGFVNVEAPKGANGYYLVSDGSNMAYRCRVRSPSFPHMQMVPFISQGYTLADVLSILGSLDYVLADIDR